jgi:hypothetical protein
MPTPAGHRALQPRPRPAVVVGAEDTTRALEVLVTEQHLNDWIDHHLRDIAAAREQACEAALQSGRFGVLEVWRGTAVTFELSPNVPYGTLHVQERRP